MRQACWPGLAAMETEVRRVRRLPLPGKVLGKEGDQVDASTVVARADIPGPGHIVPAAEELKVKPGGLARALAVKEGDSVETGDVLARHQAFFGLVRRHCVSPAKGRVEKICLDIGEITIREASASIKLQAGLAGKIVSVLPDGVEIKTPAALVQGIYGYGQGGWGKLRLPVKKPTETLAPGQIDEKDLGCILVAGTGVSSQALSRAKEMGVVGIITGGMLAKDLQGFGSHGDVGLALVITEGFGKIPMAAATFDLLQNLEGERGFIDFLRLGSVLRPEIIVPRHGAIRTGGTHKLAMGAWVRIIGGPWFGRIGMVTKLPVQPQRIESEAVVRVLEVELDGGKRVTVPRANVELLRI